MNEVNTDLIVQKLAEIQRKIRRIGPVMRGSVTHMGTRHKQPYFSVGINGKTRVLYLGAARAVTAKKYLANYGKLMSLVDEMTILHMELLKAQGSGASEPPTECNGEKSANGRN